MLSALGDPVLPIFAVLALGYAMAKLGFMAVAHAQAINRFVFYLGAPALGVRVISGTPLDGIGWGPVLVYFCVEVLVYAAVFALMRYVFRREAAEALLLGMTAIFANHVFFVLPISERFYGPEVVGAMSGILLLDIAVLFCGSVVLTEFVTGGNRGLRGTLSGLARNPFVYAPPIGVALGFLGEATPSGIGTFLGFASAAAAPVTLFSLGITLAASPIFPIRLPCWSVTAAKVLIVPALVWAGLRGLQSEMDALAPTVTLLVAAAPCGAMPYVIATQYEVRTVTIAKTIFISTVASLVTLSALLP